MNKAIFTNDAPKAIGPYSQAIVSTAQKFVFVSGQLPFCPKEMAILTTDVALQAKQVLLNLQAILKASDASLNNVVKVTVYLADINDFNKVNQVYETFFSEHKPARVCLQVAALPKAALVEMDAIAAL